MSLASPAIAGLDTFAERLVASGVVLGVLAVAGWTAWRVGRSARRSRTRHVVDVLLGGAFLALALLAGSALVAVWGSTPAVEAVGTAIGSHVGTVALAAFSLVVLATVYVASGLGYRAVHEVADRRDTITEHQAEIVYRFLQVGIYVVAVLVVLGLWSVELGGLLVGAGFLGIVVGMAARQTLGSLIAGFVLMFARPFEIGDWVQIGDREGLVTDITIVNTRIQTYDGEYVMLPNDTVSSSEVVNRTRKGRLRLHVEVGVDYATDLDRAVAVAREAMGDVEEILAVPQPEVVLSGFDDSAVVLDLMFWIDRPTARRRWRARTAVIRAVKRAFDEAGVKIPFPQREMTGREEAGGFRVRDGTPTFAGAARRSTTTGDGPATGPEGGSGDPSERDSGDGPGRGPGDGSGDSPADGAGDGPADGSEGGPADGSEAADEPRSRTGGPPGSRDD